MKARIAAFAGAVVAAAIATPAAAQGACTRDQLQAMADSWISAVERGTMMAMELGEWVDYNENFARGSLGSFLDRPREVNWNLSLLDTAQCKVFVEAVMLDDARPMVTAMQFGRGFFGVGPFDHIVTDAGDWLFDAEATYEYARRENWDVIPEERRNTREELIAAADAYLNLFADPNVEVPWGEPCARLEGGAYTGRGQAIDTCNVGVPQGVELKNRRYVVDEARGAVNVFLEFGENRRPDSHTFRIENGRLRYVHTLTYCTEDNCGFDPFDQMLARNPDMQPPYAD